MIYGIQKIFDVNLKESCTIKFVYIPLKIGGILKLLFDFRRVKFALSGSSIHTQLKTTPSTLHPISPYIPQRFTQR